MDARTLVRYALTILPRALRRKMASRLRPWLRAKGLYTARCRGLTLALDFDEHSAVPLYADGLIERPLRRTLLSVLRPGMTFFDVGANIGYFSLLAAQQVGSTGRVVAFEPVPRNLEFLRRNLTLNPALNIITVVPAAVSESRGETTLHLGWHEGNASLLADARGTTTDAISVPTLPLDAYLEEQGIERVDVLKMDIEGAEIFALAGMAKGLEAGRYGHLLIEWHIGDHTGLGDRPGETLAHLRKCGYILHRIHKHHAAPLTEEDLTRNRVHIWAQPK